jgi:hypothetical protein
MSAEAHQIRKTQLALAIAQGISPKKWAEAKPTMEKGVGNRFRILVNHRVLDTARQLIDDSRRMARSANSIQPCEE